MSEQQNLDSTSVLQPAIPAGLIANYMLDALLDIQWLLEFGDGNIVDIDDSNLSKTVSDTVVQLIALRCLATGIPPTAVIQEIYPGSDADRNKPVYEPLARKVENTLRQIALVHRIYYGNNGSAVVT